MGLHLVTARPAATASSGNPIIPHRGVTDPHIHIFDDEAYLYASHDLSPTNDGFIMEDWQVWSSRDLVSWEHRSTLRPEHTYLEKTGGFVSAWATDAAEKAGRYYWFFSNATKEIGVVVSDSPVGPWRDPIGRPLITATDVDTEPYDPTVYAEGDDRYIVFGVWDYFIAKLSDDLTALAEPPTRLEIVGAQGPYTNVVASPFAGKNTDDKPFLHRHGDLYYLSWGAYYATSAALRGPYVYRGCLIDASSFPDGLSRPTWPHGPQQGRHGSFFEWHGQTYFAYCDMSQTGNRYFRDSFISYVHYRADGTIAPLRIDRVGVGQYDNTNMPIQAQDYFAANNVVKREDHTASGGFVVAAKHNMSARLTFPKVWNAAGASVLRMNARGASGAQIEVSAWSDSGERLAEGGAVIGSGDSIELDLTLTRSFESVEGLTIEWRGAAAVDWVHLRHETQRGQDSDWR